MPKDCNSSCLTESLSPAVELRAVRKSYPEGSGSRLIFASLDAAFVRGEIVALVGKSGSGKSTLLNLIIGIDLPDDGEVIIAETHLTSLSEKDRTLFRRNHIGFVFQLFNLLPTLTVKENLLLPLELKGTADLLHVRRAMELLDEVGLADRAESFPDMLSGGEQQRVAVARALVHGPEVLLADEPTGNLDSETGQQVLSIMAELVKSRSMTAVVVTHSAEVARVADRVMALRRENLILLESERVA